MRSREKAKRKRVEVRRKQNMGRGMEKKTRGGREGSLQTTAPEVRNFGRARHGASWKVEG